MITNQGAVIDIVLSAADASEPTVAEHLLAPKAGVTVLAANRYSSFWLRNLFGRQGGRLLFGQRPTQRVFIEASDYWLRRFFRCSPTSSRLRRLERVRPSV